MGLQPSWAAVVWERDGEGEESSAPTAMALVNVFRTENLPWVEVFVVQHPRKVLGITESLRLGKAAKIISPIHQPITTTTSAPHCTSPAELSFGLLALRWQGDTFIRRKMA